MQKISKFTSKQGVWNDNLWQLFFFPQKTILSEIKWLMKVIKRSLLFTYVSEAQKPAVLTRASITPYDNTLKQGRMLELKKKKCKWYYKLLTLLSNDTFLCNKFKEYLQNWKMCYTRGYICSAVRGTNKRLSLYPLKEGKRVACHSKEIERV